MEILERVVPVTGPEVGPDGGGVFADGGDEPLGVVVEGYVDAVGAAGGAPVYEGVQDGGGADYAGAVVGVGEDGGYGLGVAHGVAVGEGDAAALGVLVEVGDVFGVWGGGGVCTYCVADLLPAASMLPGAVPAVAVLFDVDDSSTAVFDEREDVFAAEAVFLHDFGAVAFNDHVGFFDEVEEFEAVLFVFNVQVGGPFAWGPMLAVD